MKLLFLCAVGVTMIYAPVSAITCASTTCQVFATCRDVLNTTSGEISGVCMNPVLYPPTQNEDRCTDGQPLWVTNSDGEFSEATCGPNGTVCPSGFTCVRARNDAFAVCCPGSSPEKVGECPVPLNGSAEFCNDTCQSDSDCDDDLKCCRNNCSALTCQSPVGIDINTCETMDCEPGMVCVNTPTGPQCAPSIREGRCPASHNHPGVLVCRDQCATDADCPGFQKCCTGFPFLCRYCRNPEPSVTCENITCLANQTCAMKQVQCVQAPCFPVPTCLDGSCPFSPAFVPHYCHHRRVSRCFRDDMCPSGQLCCRTICGRSDCLTPS